MDLMSGNLAALFEWEDTDGYTDILYSVAASGKRTPWVNVTRGNRPQGYLVSLNTERNYNHVSSAVMPYTGRVIDRNGAKDRAYKILILAVYHHAAQGDLVACELLSLITAKLEEANHE